MEVDGAPDLTDFMNDWFFGTVGARHSGGGYDLTGESSKRLASPAGNKKQGKSGGGGSSASKQTQDWLEEARRMVGAGSPGRKGVGSGRRPGSCPGSPADLGRSPRRRSTAGTRCRGPPEGKTRSLSSVQACTVHHARALT